jgi:hypothetical protein
LTNITFFDFISTGVKGRLIFLTVHTGQKVTVLLFRSSIIPIKLSLYARGR